LAVDQCMVSSWSKTWGLCVKCGLLLQHMHDQGPLHFSPDKQKLQPKLWTLQFLWKLYKRCCSTRPYLWALRLKGCFRKAYSKEKQVWLWRAISFILQDFTGRSSNLQTDVWSSNFTILFEDHFEL